MINLKSLYLITNCRTWCHLVAVSRMTQELPHLVSMFNVTGKRYFVIVWGSWSPVSEMWCLHSDSLNAIADQRELCRCYCVIFTSINISRLFILIIEELNMKWAGSDLTPKKMCIFYLHLNVKKKKKENKENKKGGCLTQKHTDAKSYLRFDCLDTIWKGELGYKDRNKYS